MAIPIDINQLLNSDIVESDRIELKEDFNPTPIVHSICAFANDIDNIGGGYIIIGVKEIDGNYMINGIKKKRVDSILKKLLQLCHYIEPFYEPVAEPVKYNDKNLILIWCAAGFGRPYKAPKDAIAKQSYKYYYIRKFSSSVIASSDEEKELFYISSNIPFDDRSHLAASINDLSRNIIIDHLRKINSHLYELADHLSLEELADDLQLLSGPPESRKPRNVGILMFSDKTQYYFRYARIEVVDIPDPTGSNMTEKLFTGTIQNQLEDALLFIKNYALKEKIIKADNTAAALRIWNYPYRAIEEILCNAVYHRSYSISEPVTVKITPESIEITSFPGFSRSITDEDIRSQNIKGKIYRNRRIGDFLKELKLIEGRNTGFPNAKNALKKNESPPLKFEMDPQRQYLTVIIPINAAFLDSRKNKDIDYRDKILNNLKDHPMTLTELATSMGYKGITNKLRKAVNLMIKSHQLEKDAYTRKIKIIEHDYLK